MRAVLGSIVLLGVTARAAWAQGPCPERSPDSVAAVCQLDPWAGPLHQPVGVYPPLLLEAGVEGRVHLRLLVDSLGRPVPSSLRMRNTHDLFGRAVAQMVPHWRFAPPRRGGRGTTVRYEATLTYLPLALEGEAVVDVTPGPDTVTAPPPALNPRHWPSPTSMLPADTALLASQEPALRVLTRALDTLPRRPTVCLHALGAPGTRLTEALSTRTLTVTIPAYCPRTYSSSIRVVGPAAVRPPRGWIDPVGLTVAGIEAVRPGLVRVFIEQSQGTSGRRYTCGVRRVGAQWTQAACAPGIRWIS